MGSHASCVCPAASLRRRTWASPTSRSWGTARLLLEKGSEIFAQVGVGRPAGAGGRRPLREAATLARSPFFRRGGDAETSSAGGPSAGGRWVAGASAEERHPGLDVTSSGVGRSCGGGRLSPEPSSYRPVAPLRGRSFSSQDFPVLPPPRRPPRARGIFPALLFQTSQVPTLPPPPPGQFPAQLIWRPWVPGPPDLWSTLQTLINSGRHPPGSG